jgi:hypothetical protein
MAYTNIDDPSAHFQVALFTGNNTANHAITNDGNSDLQPDWLLFKHRTGSHDWYVVDSSRGRDKGLATNSNAAETTSSSSTQDFQSFDTNGFTVGTVETTDSINAGGGSTIAAWQWKANGGTTSSNTDGTITSTVQANTDAGFSIVTYTGNATNNATVGHGLGVAPSVIIIKDLTDGSVWGVWHKDLTDAGYRLTLHSDAAISNDPGFMGGGNRTLPTSSVFSLGQGGGGNGTNGYVAYCFAEKQGYSKFGSYVGNAITNGPFVYTGFKPGCIITKTTTVAEGWGIYDYKRSGFNVYNDVLGLDTNLGTYGGANYNFMDILSNGFKCRRATYGPNQSTTYIYLAWAENPFVTSTGTPTTAR